MTTHQKLTASFAQAGTATLILLFAGLLIPEPGFAKIYKCESSGGQTEYSSLPCANAAQQSTVRIQENTASRKSSKKRRATNTATSKRASKASSRKTSRRSKNRSYTSDSFCAKALKEIAVSRKRGSIGVRRRDGSAEIHTGERAARTADEAERVFSGLCN